MGPTERAMLLLRCRLGEPVQPLSQTEYAQIWRLLENTGSFEEDAQLSQDFLETLGLEEETARRVLCLLDRDHQPEAYLTSQPDISVLTRISPEFPHRLRSLGKECPPVLFCKGDLRLLQKPAISLVGSRLLFERGERFAQRVGCLAAKEGYVLVSGNAAGADRSAQNACLEAGGEVISVVPDRLEKCSLRQGQLFLCDEGYDCGFTPARALRRNHFIHALGEKTLVAQCPIASGGTWSGAEDNLRRELSPLYVLQDGSEGAAALGALGAVFVTDDLPSLRDLKPLQLSIFD